MPRTGRPRLEPDLKARRGTLRPHRERQRRRERVQASAVAVPQPVQAVDYVAIADTYSHDAVSGRTVVCGWVRKAAQRFQAMRKRSEEPGCSYAFSPEHANAVCGFIERLPHVEGRWGAETIELQPWQVFILVACYG